MGDNKLQAVLDRAKTQPSKPKATAKKTATKSQKIVKEVKAGRSNTVLVGGHFSPEVSKQLKIIAAEEGTTNQALLEQALDLLFVKKGKGRISDL